MQISTVLVIAHAKLMPMGFHASTQPIINQQKLYTIKPYFPCILHTIYVRIRVIVKDKKKSPQNATITVNRKARYDYHLHDRYEVGIVLQGTEVKAIRNGQFNLTDSYAQITDGEVFLIDAFIGLYDQANRMNHEPKRPRKLLLHRNEIRKLARSVQSKGMTLIPTRAYFSGGKVKLELAIAQGKRVYDKRDKIEREQANREIREYS